jgi:hypothetical protein
MLRSRMMSLPSLWAITLATSCESIDTGDRLVGGGSFRIRRNPPAVLEVEFLAGGEEVVPLAVVVLAVVDPDDPPTDHLEPVPSTTMAVASSIPKRANPGGRR